MKALERTRAIQMRKEGKTYSEILEIIPVAKSTLSLWLRSVNLAVPQKQRITRKRVEAQQKGALSRHMTRMREIRDLLAVGRTEVGTITKRELWLLGIALYWAEGSKQNATSISAGIRFANSDVRMIRVFLTWLRNMNIPESEISFELYVHDNCRNDTEIFCAWWARELSIMHARIDRVYYKRDKLRTRRTNVGDLYHGLLRIKVARSTSLNRSIQGWIQGIAHNVENWEIV